jgi:N-acetylmuramoyl-L-alanine amidase
MQMRELLRYGVPVALAILVSGCGTVATVQPVQETSMVPLGTISAQELAQRLGMTVEEDSSVQVALSKGSSRVIIFPDPAGQAFVNGTLVWSQGGIARVSGILYVPAGLEDAIRSALAQIPGPARHARVPQQPATHDRLRLARAYRIVIDPGHGGKDPGTHSRSGLQEKTATLQVAMELARLLKEDGFAVAMTRQTDVFIDLDERVAIANRFGADLFVSIHGDSCPDPFTRGFTIYTCEGASAESRRVAESVATSLKAAERQSGHAPGELPRTRPNPMSRHSGGARAPFQQSGR